MKNEVAEVILACRKYHGYTQAYMAHKLDVTIHSYANIEHGRVDVSIPKLYQISKLLAIKSCQILALAEEIHEAEEHGSLFSALKYIIA